MTNAWIWAWEILAAEKKALHLKRRGEYAKLLERTVKVGVCLLKNLTSKFHKPHVEYLAVNDKAPRQTSRAHIEAVSSCLENGAVVHERYQKSVRAQIIRTNETCASATWAYLHQSNLMWSDSVRETCRWMLFTQLYIAFCICLHTFCSWGYESSPRK